MRNATLVHVAGHAQHEAIAADRAGFLLSDRTVLSGRDVVELGLQGDVAFLSGCDTGSVGIKRGDELAGLAVGFLRAGFRCVVAARWPVSDESTDILVRDVYSAAPDATWAQALRRAQSAMIADVARQHPYHWAGFAVWGSAVTNLDVARQRAGWTASKNFPGISGAGDKSAGSMMPVLSKIIRRRRREVIACDKTHESAGLGS
jgi:CHAT domain